MIMFNHFNYLVCLINDEDEIIWDSLGSNEAHLQAFRNPMPYRKKDITTLFHFFT